MENKLREQIISLIADKLKRLAISDSELTTDFDLVKSGLLNSLEFVDLVASLERTFGMEIDFEKALDEGDLTTIKGLMKTFSQ